MNDSGSVHGLTAENILTAFPIALQGDQDAAALAEVTARLLARRPEEIDRLRIYPDIDHLDEKLLDILAYDFKVDWWNPNYTLEEKQRTLADSWHVHKILGTKAAVEMAIRDIYPKTEVQEWFEYEGGKPYHFKLNMDLTDTFGDETRPWAVLERVNFYKSLRSHLEAVVFTMTTVPTTLHIGGGFGAAVNIGVSIAEDVYDGRSVLSVGGTLGENVSVGVPAGIDAFDFRQTLRTGGSFGADAAVGVPAEPDVQHFQTTLHAGMTGGIHSTVGEPENIVPPPSTTILRTGGVCTILSNLSKGE